MQKTYKNKLDFNVKKFVDLETGEVIETNTISSQNSDYDFKKIWIKNYLNTIDVISNKKIKVANWLVENIDYKNEIYFTFDSLAQKLEMSRTTIFDTITILLEQNFLVKKQLGVYQLNPEIVFKGNHNQRMYILNEFNKTKKEEIDKSTILKNYMEQIEILSKKVKLLEIEIQKEKLEEEINKIQKLEEDNDQVPLV